MQRSPQTVQDALERLEDHRASEASCMRKWGTMSPMSGRHKDRHGIVVRVLRYKFDDPRRTGHDEEYTLSTSLLDAEECPAGERIGLDYERWKAA